MKNDFEFIRDKIEESGVKAPESMDESFVLSRLDGVEPEASPKVVEFKPKKPRYAMFAGIAAAFVAVVTLSICGAIFFSNKDVEPSHRISVAKPSVSADIPLKSFSSYDELRAHTKSIADKYAASYYSGSPRYDSYILEENAAAAPDSAKSGSSGSSTGSSGSSTGSSGSAVSDSFSETYKQVEGVDEADIVKTDGRYLYVVQNGSPECIRIYSATDTPELTATIFPERFDDPDATPDEESYNDDDPDVFVEEMFLRDGKLITICLIRDEHFDYSTSAFVYDVSDIKDITVADRFNQSGYYSTSRMIGDSLYIITSYSVYDSDFDIPVCYRGAEKNEIPIDCVYSLEKPVDDSMMIVGGYSLADGSSDVQATAVVGVVEDNVYCNENNLYIYATEWQYYALVDYEINDPDNAVSDTAPNNDTITTGIYKVSLSDGIAFTAYGSVEGYLYDRYALDEKNGYLRVAATVSDIFYDETNRLYILDSSLQQVGAVTDIAPGESIKAVRYVGDTAYVITYEQTDPLFVIDVSDPTAPKVLGEVKIDGFSSMLVPVDENTVLGLGYYTEDSERGTMQVQNGFKLALFDVSDKTNPKVLDEKIYRNYYSPVMSEPRALVYNPDRGDYLIPLNFYDAHLNSEIDYYMPDIRGGALNFKVEDGKLVEIDHPEVNFDNSDADEIGRCLYVGDNIYMISNGYYQDVSVYTAKYQ